MDDYIFDSLDNSYFNKRNKIKFGRIYKLDRWHAARQHHAACGCDLIKIDRDRSIWDFLERGNHLQNVYFETGWTDGGLKSLYVQLIDGGKRALTDRYPISSIKECIENLAYQKAGQLMSCKNNSHWKAGV